MYLLNASKETLTSLNKEASSYRNYSSIASSLNDGEYDIVYSLLSSGSILYEALPKEGSAAPILSFMVGPDKVAKPYYPYDNGSYNVFAAYIAKKDNGKSLDELKETYGSDFDHLYPLASLVESEGKEVKKAEEDLGKIKQDLLSIAAPRSENATHYSLLFSFERGYYDKKSIEVSANLLKPTSRTGVKLDHLRMFLSSLLVDEEYRKGRETYSLSSFPPNYKDIFSYLLSHSKPDSYYDDHLLMSLSGFSGLCELIKGEKIFFEGYPYSVLPEPILAKASIDDNGKMVVEPTISKGAEVIINECYGILVESSVRSITVLKFETPLSGKLYAFFVKHHDLPESYLSSILTRDILPFTKPKDLPVSSNYLSSHEIKKDEIIFYLTYTDNDALECKTIYKVLNAEAKENEFLSSSSFNEERGKAFKDTLSSLFLIPSGVIKDDETIVKILHEDLTILNSLATVYLSDNIANKKVVSTPSIKIEATSGEDWFALSLHSEKYKEEDLYHLLQAYKKKKKYVRLGDSFLFFDEADPKETDELNRLSDDFDLEPGKKMPLYEALKLSSYTKGELSLTDSLRKMLESLQDYDKEPLNGLGPNFKSVLRPYQISGVRWLKTLENNSLSGILADDMGLGKTLETIAYLSISSLNAPILIISPKSLIYNWENEFNKWDGKTKVHVIDGSLAQREATLAKMDPKKREAYITSYDSLRNDIELYKKHSYGYVILDEGQYIANALAKKTIAVKELEATNRLVLTGTPIQNSLMDLWSIFDFLLPGYLSKYSSFKKLYGSLDIEEETKSHLQKKIAPFILSRKKEDVLKDLPPKEELVLTIALSDEQRSLYEAYLAKARSALRDTRDSPFLADKKIALLAALTRLREICVDPSIFLPNAGEGEKIDSLVLQLKEAIGTGHKCIVFSSFSSALIHLSSFLDKEGLSWGLIYGDTPAKERIVLADSFNNDKDPKIMLVSLKAGGTGLNLIGGDYVFHLDPWWNLAAEHQASDRAHRIGQTRKVTVYKLVAKDSVEEKVISLQAKKASLAGIIAKGDEGLSSLSSEDIAFLLD